MVCGMCVVAVHPFHCCVRIVRKGSRMRRCRGEEGEEDEKVWNRTDALYTLYCYGQVIQKNC